MGFPSASRNTYVFVDHDRRSKVLAGHLQVRVAASYPSESKTLPGEIARGSMSEPC